MSPKQTWTTEKEVLNSEALLKANLLNTYVPVIMHKGTKVPFANGPWKTFENLETSPSTGHYHQNSWHQISYVHCESLKCDFERTQWFYTFCHKTLNTPTTFHVYPTILANLTSNDHWSSKFLALDDDYILHGSGKSNKSCKFDPYWPRKDLPTFWSQMVITSSKFGCNPNLGYKVTTNQWFGPYMTSDDLQMTFTFFGTEWRRAVTWVGRRKDLDMYYLQYRRYIILTEF